MTELPTVAKRARAYVAGIVIELNLLECSAALKRWLTKRAPSSPKIRGANSVTRRNTRGGIFGCHWTTTVGSRNCSAGGVPPKSSPRLDLNARLVALVPMARVNPTRFHGVRRPARRREGHDVLCQPVTRPQHRVCGIEQRDDPLPVLFTLWSFRDRHRRCHPILGRHRRAIPAAHENGPIFAYENRPSGRALWKRGLD